MFAIITRLAGAVVCAAIAVTFVPSSASECRRDLADGASPNEWREAFDRACAPLTRGPSLNTNEGRGGAYYPDGQPVIPPPKQALANVVSVHIRFEINSARVHSSSENLLDNLATFLLDEPWRRLQIAGHADASGRHATNERLSLRRAKAVWRYLVERHAIDASRLKAIGFGARYPLPGRSPFDSLNRRVEFTQLSD